VERMREEVAESVAEAHERLTEIGLSARTERKRPGGGQYRHLPHCEADEWKPHVMSVDPSGRGSRRVSHRTIRVAAMTSTTYRAVSLVRTAPSSSTPAGKDRSLL